MTHDESRALDREALGDIDGLVDRLELIVFLAGYEGRGLYELQKDHGTDCQEAIESWRLLGQRCADALVSIEAHREALERRLSTLPEPVLTGRSHRPELTLWKRRGARCRRRLLIRCGRTASP